MAGIVIRSTQDRRRMDGSYYVRVQPRLHPFPAIARDQKVSSQQSLSSCRSEQYDNFGPHGMNFCIEPGTAGADLKRVWLLMNSAFSPWLPFEMLDDVGKVNVFAVNTSSGQCLVEHNSRGTNERPALKIFLVARLFAYHHYARMLPALAKHGLSAAFPEIASPASRSSFAQHRQVVRGGHRSFSIGKYAS